jgi:hypothetical protein
MLIKLTNFVNFNSAIAYPFNWGIVKPGHRQNEWGGESDRKDDGGANAGK